MAIFSKLNMACAWAGIIWPSSTARMRGLTSSNALAWMQRCAQCTIMKLTAAEPALAHLDRQHASLTALGNGTKCTNQLISLMAQGCRRMARSRRRANAFAKTILSSGCRVTDANILSVLRVWRFKRNKTRKNVMSPDSTETMLQLMV